MEFDLNKKSAVQTAFDELHADIMLMADKLSEYRELAEDKFSHKKVPSSSEFCLPYDVVTLVKKSDWTITNYFIIDQHTDQKLIEDEYYIFRSKYTHANICNALNFIEEKKPRFSKSQIEDALTHLSYHAANRIKLLLNLPIRLL